MSRSGGIGRTASHMVANSAHPEYLLLTSTVIGRRTFAHRITTPTRAIDWPAGDWADLEHTPITVPVPIAAALRAYLDQFGLVFGCFDFALDETEKWIFIEFTDRPGHGACICRLPHGRMAAVSASTTTELDANAARLRVELAQTLAEHNVLPDPGWREAVETVPRHRFVPGFYLPTEQRSAGGLTVWEPFTERTDTQGWLAAAYSDETLITQFDGDEPDWEHPTPRDGGAPTSSSTLPSLVMRMWADADVHDGHTVLEIGTGTGYSTGLGCERLGSDAVTSIEIDPHRLQQAADALHACGYAPGLAVADGLYGYRPYAPYDRIVAGCSVRTIPPAWLAQTRPGGKILTTLGGWLYGYARVLLTVGADGAASGPLLPGTISFMAARTHEAPTLGNPAHWSDLHRDDPRPARHAPERITAATDEAFLPGSSPNAPRRTPS